MVKMKKPSEKKSLIKNWEGPYLFVGYVDEHDNLESDEGGQKCIYKVRMNINGSAQEGTYSCIIRKHN